MKISPEQRKALEAAGYTISRSGRTVQSPNGGTVGGYNENGKLFAGSKKVMDILKGAGSSAPSASAKAETKPASRPRQEQASPRSSGRGNGSSETTRRNTDKPKVSSGRGSGAGEVARRRSDAKGSEIAGAVTGAAAVAGSAALGAAAARKKARDARRTQAQARGSAYNPSYTGKTKMPEGPQGRYNTSVGRPRGPSAAGVALNPARSARRIAGGRMNSLDPRNNPYRLD